MTPEEASFDDAARGRRRPPALEKGRQWGLAVYGNVEYDQNTQIPFGQMDCMIEGLNLSDLKRKEPFEVRSRG